MAQARVSQVSTNFPDPNVQLVNSEGFITEQWRRFLQSIFTRTGSAVGVNAATVQSTVIINTTTIDSLQSLFIEEIAGIPPPSTIIDQSLTGLFFENQGAIIDRLADRVFIGGATVNDGSFPNVTQDWLSTIIGSAEPTVSVSTLAVLSDFGLIGILGASQSVQNSSPGSEGCIGLSGFVINNNTTSVQTAYACYLEARHELGVTAGSITQGFECDIANLNGTVVPIQPYDPFVSNATYGLFSSSGAGISSGLSDASCAFLIANNGAGFSKGIVFHSTSITGTNGITGAGVAVALARGHNIEWYTPNGSQAGCIGSTASTNGGPGYAQMLFTDTGIQFQNNVGDGLLGLSPVVPPAVGDTSLFVYVKNNAGANLATVTLGSVNSGGTGFRSLVVPN